MDKKQKIEEVRKQHNCLEFVVYLMLFPSEVLLKFYTQVRQCDGAD
jgi:hypothetical protein